MLPNSTQLQVTTAAVVSGAAGFAAGHGWLGLGVGDWGTIFGALAMLAPILWPAVVTRLQSLKNTVGNSGAVVITSAASANALPDNPNVVAATPAVTAAIKQSQ